jgi:hypothetical protein
LASGCGRGQEPLSAPETFSWCAQPITFSPPASSWYREGENGGGMLGVRFVLKGGAGQCITVLTFHTLAERNRRDAITRLIARQDSLGKREFLRELSLARARTDDPMSDREVAVATAINDALNRAEVEYFADRGLFVKANLEEALRAAGAFDVTLADVLPRLRLRPERMQEPERWRLGAQRDTTVAGYPAFAGDDTLITPEAALLYREVIWVVNRCAFKAIYQGTKENLPTFDRLVGSIRFPAGASAS